MNLGDTFVDPQKRTWTLEEFLGQGTWGRSFRARAADGHQCVLKVALQASDFPSDSPLPDGLIRACRDAAREQIALLEQGAHGFLPRLIGSFTLSSGTPALMLAHYGSTLQRRIATGAGLAETLDLLARLSEQLGKARFVHGNLRPSNIFVNDRGEPVVSDPITPALAPVLARLDQLRGAVRWRPPEATDHPHPMWDTWALCQALYQTALHRESTAEARPAPQGLDKVEIATLKDRALARFKYEGTNPRFQSRMADRLGALLHRGLSLATEPSPPYRFIDCVALAERLHEVVAMVEPHVEDVGRLLPPAESVSGVFRGDKPVDFTVSVGCSAGVTNHEDVVCGLQLVDLDDKDSRIPLPEAQYKVERHRSGRLRFQFSLPDLPPGRFRLKIAFTVRDSRSEPQVAAGEFEVRPPPGYVPPAREIDQGAPIMLDRVRRTEEPAEAQDVRPRAQSAGPRVHAPVETPIAGEITAAVVTSASDPGSDSGAEVIEGLFPRPIDPPTDQPAYPPTFGRSIPVEVSVEATEPALNPPLEMPMSAAASAGSPMAYHPGAGSRPVATGGVLAMPSVSLGRANVPMYTPPGAPTTPPAAAIPAPPPPPSGPDARWFAGPLDEFGIEGDGLLPGLHEDGEELPDWNSERLGDKLRSLPGFDLFFEWMQRDAYTAFVAAAAGSFVLLLMMMALLKAF